MIKRSHKIYVLGNPLLRADSLPLRILPKLKEMKEFQDIEFIELDPTEDFPQEKNLCIIDTIVNTGTSVQDDVMVIRGIGNIDKFTPSPNYSLHDFDLAFQLKLMKKMGTIDDITIIGIPTSFDEDDALEKVKRALSDIIKTS
jgi:Ni,Fe-hydrogenase maturation factor